jgi:hypothetical protein
MDVPTFLKPAMDVPTFLKPAMDVRIYANRQCLF